MCMSSTSEEGRCTPKTLWSSLSMAIRDFTAWSLKTFCSFCRPVLDKSSWAFNFKLKLIWCSHTLFAFYIEIKTENHPALVTSMSTLLPVSLQLSIKRACQMQSQQRWTALNGVANLLMLLHHCSPALTLLIFSLLQKSSSNITSDILAPVYLRHSISDFNLANPSNFHTSTTCLQVAGPGHLEGSGMEQLEPAHQSRTFQPQKAQKPVWHLVNDRVNRKSGRQKWHPSCWYSSKQL